MVYFAGLHLIIVIISNKLWIIEEPFKGGKLREIGLAYIAGQPEAVSREKVPPNMPCGIRVAPIVEQSIRSSESQSLSANEKERVIQWHKIKR